MKVTKILFVLLLFYLLVFFTGCGQEANDDDTDAGLESGSGETGDTNASEEDAGSVQVYEIVYSTGEKTVTLTSKVYFKYSLEDVSMEEYMAAKDYEILGAKYYISATFQADGTVQGDSDSYRFDNDDTLEQLNSYVGKTYYCTDRYGAYKKITYTSLIVAYINVVFLNDGTIEVSYYDNYLKATITERIKTEYYKITYFSGQGN